MSTISALKSLAATMSTSPDDPDFKQCWALSNLRPLWAEENLRKGSSRVEESEVA